MKKISQIIIFSSKSDFTTNDVIEWIESKNNFKFIRICGSQIEFIPLITCLLSNKTNKFLFNNTPVKSIWFRKASSIGTIEADKYEKRIEEFLTQEITEFRSLIFFFTQFCKVKILGTNRTGFYDTSKYQVLLLAKKTGLTIPNTVITTSFAEVLSFQKRHKNIIAKPLTNPVFLSSKDKKQTYAMYTNIINEAVISNINKNIVFPCFIQEYIEKLIELRIFFYEDNYFCSAIFSQNNTNTSHDFRNYDRNDTNRIVPFKLDTKVINKLKKLMELLGLNTGSIDMILTPSGEYIFLEVNPVGQFGMISAPCNFYLEKRLAEYLTNN